MPETVLPDTEVTSYFLETLVPVSGHDELVNRIGEGVGMYLLDLMAEHGYRVVSGVRMSMPEPALVEYPDGLAVLRAEVDVQELDVTV